MGFFSFSKNHKNYGVLEKSFNGCGYKMQLRVQGFIAIMQHNGLYHGGNGEDDLLQNNI